MSAAAPVVTKQVCPIERRSPDRLRKAWAERLESSRFAAERSPEPSGNFAIIDTRLLDAIFIDDRCPPIERRIIALVLRETVGAIPRDKTGAYKGKHAGRPGWFAGTHAEVAEFLNVSSTIVQAAFANLTSTEWGLLEEETFGRNKVYRVRPENAEKVPAKEAKTAPRKPMAVEEAVHQVRSSTDAIPLPPGKRSDPISIGILAGQTQEALRNLAEIRYHNTSPYQLRLNLGANAGVLEFVVSGEENASDLPTPVGPSKGRKQSAGGEQKGKHLPTYVGRSNAQVIDSATTADLDPVEIDRTRVVLNRALGKLIGPIPDEKLFPIVKSLSEDEIPLDELARQINNRMILFTSPRRSWGGVEALLNGLVTAKRAGAAAEARAGHLVKPAREPARELTLDEIADREMAKWGSKS